MPYHTIPHIAVLCPATLFHTAPSPVALCHTVPCCVLPHHVSCTTLCRTILCRTVPHCTDPHHLHCATLHNSMPFHPAWSHAMLSHAGVLGRAVPCHTTALCCAMPCCFCPALGRAPQSTGSSAALPSTSQGHAGQRPARAVGGCGGCPAGEESAGGVPSVGSSTCAGAGGFRLFAAGPGPGVQTGTRGAPLSTRRHSSLWG